MVFLALDDICSSDGERVPSYVLDVIRQAFSILSQALPVEFIVTLQLDQMDNVSEGQCEIRTLIHLYSLKMHNRDPSHV